MVQVLCMHHNGCNWLTSLFHDLHAGCPLHSHRTPGQLCIPTGPPPACPTLLPAHYYIQPPQCAQPSQQLQALGPTGPGPRLPHPTSFTPLGGQGLPQHISYPAGLSTPPPMLTTPAAQLPQSAMTPHPPGLAPQDVHKQLEDMRQQLMAFHCMFQSGLDHEAETVSQALVPDVPTLLLCIPIRGSLQLRSSSLGQSSFLSSTMYEV